MNRDTAARAGELAARIGVLSALVADIDVAIKEGWSVNVLRACAPAEGSSKPGGQVDLLPRGPATAELSALALSTARDAYGAQLDQLNAQLAAL